MAAVNGHAIPTHRKVRRNGKVVRERIVYPPALNAEGHSAAPFRTPFNGYPAGDPVRGDTASASVEQAAARPAAFLGVDHSKSSKATLLKIGELVERDLNRVRSDRAFLEGRIKMMDATERRQSKRIVELCTAVDVLANRVTSQKSVTPFDD